MEGKILFRDDFSGGLRHWVWEGPPQPVVEVRDGALFIDPRQQGYAGYHAVNLWCRQPVAGDFSLEIDLEPLDPKPTDGRAANLLFAFCARYQDPRLDVIEFAPRRNGHYVWLTHKLETISYRGEDIQGREIPPLDSYTISYYRIAPKSDKPYLVMVRRNPDFHPMGEYLQTVEEVWAYRHQVRIEKQGDTFAFFQGEQEVFRLTDDGTLGPPLKDGYFCIRTWQASLKVHGVTVRRLP